VTWALWNLISVRLVIVLILTQDRCTVCVERTIGSYSFRTRLMELLGDVGHVESRFSPFGDSVSVGVRLVHGLCQKYHRLRKSFWMHPMEHLGDKVQVDARSSLF
jgi:hypothetical protein